MENAPSSIPGPLMTQITQQITQYSGPIPPPDLLEEYNRVISDGANRIMAMAEKQLDHRIELERTVVHGDAKRSWWGLWLGFTASIALGVIGGVVAVYASPTAGATIITSTVATLAGVFVYGQRTRRAEREHKAELMAGRRR